MNRLSVFLPFFGLSLAVVQQGGAQASAAQAASETLKATSRIVVIDVEVKDAQGNPVKNLSAPDFMLKENGAPQTIGHFEAYTALPPAEAGKWPVMPKLPANTFTNYTPVPGNGALNVLLLDALNTPLKDQSYVRTEMMKYLKTPHPGTRMAIFGLTSKLVLLQGFTSDPEVLRAAMLSTKAGPKASPLMDNAVSGDQPGADSMTDLATAAMDASGPSSAALVANLTQFDAEIKSYQLQMRIQFTLDAMNDLARYLSGLPGRKNLIWFSGSFPLNIMPDGDLTDPFAIAADYSEEFRRTSAALARSQVAVYPIDARGLMTSPSFDASNSGPKSAKAMMKAQSAFSLNQANEHGTMEQMAEDTGGKAFVNTNDLASAVQSAVEAGANYYSLTYTPTNKEWKGDFRKVQVQLAKAGYTLTYRHGYYAEDPEAKHAPKQAPMMLGGSGGGGGGRRGGGGAGSNGPEMGSGPAGVDPSKAAMRAAMHFGGPDPTEIMFKLAINPATGDAETVVAKNNVPDPKITGPFERYVIYAAALPNDFTFAPAPGGKHRLEVEFATYVYNSNGELLNMARVKTTADIDDKQLDTIRRTGLQFRGEISVPMKQQMFLRIGLHDVSSDKVGAVEIPVAVLAKLPPLPAPALKPATPPAAAAPPPPWD